MTYFLGLTLILALTVVAALILDAALTRLWTAVRTLSGVQQRDATEGS
jgi:hypothetical protein